MAVPDFQSLMLPLLRLLQDGYDHKISELTDSLADEFGLSEEERRELLSSGNQVKLVNRVAWAQVYLKKAQLIESRQRGYLHITMQGGQVLLENPHRIDKKFLERFSSYREFQSNVKQANDVRESDDERVQTPEEILDANYQNLRRTLSQDLLERVKTCSPRFFEELVVDLLVAMGYGGSHKDAGQAVGRSGDGGIDGIIKEDKLGLDVVYVQAKRWESIVGSPVVQTFAGSLEGQKARKGVLITTSRFSKDAKDFVNKIEKKIVLIDGEQLAQLMIDYGIGVSEKSTYIIKKLNEDYFSGE